MRALITFFVAVFSLVSFSSFALAGYTAPGRDAEALKKAVEFMKKQGGGGPKEAAWLLEQYKKMQRQKTAADASFGVAMNKIILNDPSNCKGFPELASAEENYRLAGETLEFLKDRLAYHACNMNYDNHIPRRLCNSLWEHWPKVTDNLLEMADKSRQVLEQAPAVCVGSKNPSGPSGVGI